MERSNTKLVIHFNVESLCHDKSLMGIPVYVYARCIAILGAVEVSLSKRSFLAQMFYTKSNNICEQNIFAIYVTHQLF